MAESDVRGDERRGIVRRDGEHTQRLAERDRRLLGHPAELAAADHADDGKAGNWVHEQVTLPAPPCEPDARSAERPPAERSGISDTPTAWPASAASPRPVRRRYAAGSPPRSVA